MGDNQRNISDTPRDFTTDPESSGLGWPYILIVVSVIIISFLIIYIIFKLWKHFENKRQSNLKFVSIDSITN